MSKTFSNRQNFWREQMMDRNKEVVNRAVNVANNTKNFDIGGIRKQLPRQIPVGSFNAPFGANSGFESTNREVKGSGANYPVREGHKLSEMLLQQRGKQLEALQEIKSGILQPPKTEERAEADETQKQSIELLMSNIMESSTAGKLDELKLEELRKLVNALVRHGLSLDAGTLDRYKKILKEVMLEIIAYFQEKSRMYDMKDLPLLTKEQKLAVERSGSYNFKNYEKALPVFNLIFKAYNLIVALIGNINMGESDRELNFKAEAKRILQAKPLKSVNITQRQFADSLLSLQEETRKRTGELPKPPALKAYSQRRGELQDKLFDLRADERKAYMDAVDELRGRPFTQDGYESRRDYYDVKDGNLFSSIRPQLPAHPRGLPPPSRPRTQAEIARDESESKEEEDDLVNPFADHPLHDEIARADETLERMERDRRRFVPEAEMPYSDLPIELPDRPARPATPPITQREREIMRRMRQRQRRERPAFFEPDLQAPAMPSGEELLRRGVFGEGKQKSYEEQHSRDDGLFRTAGREEHRRIRAEGRPHAEINFETDFMFDNIDH